MINSENMINATLQHDPLTNLPTLAELLPRIEYAIDNAQKEHCHFALVFFDIDNFHTLNEKLSTDHGDAALKAITQRLERFLTPNDVLARIGGDEFVILIHHIKQLDDAMNKIEPYLHVFKHPFSLCGLRHKLTISAGISVYPNDGSDAKTLLRSADIALYRAKNAGPDHYQFYSDDIHKRIYASLSFGNDIFDAFIKNEFFLQYQPVVNLQTGQVTAVEALIRWLHPNKGVISPKVFLPLIEAYGLTHRLSAWVIENACLQLHQWQMKGLPPIKIAINISAHELNNRNFVAMIDQVLSETHVDPNQLEIELSEDILIENTIDSMNTLIQLSKRDVSLSIDDFGTGYSSLSYLKRLPVKKLKIDRDFIRSIPNNIEDTIIVKSIIALSNRLGLITTAEGVETKDQLTFLTEQRCQTAQGFYLAKPMDAAACTIYLREQATNIPHP